MSAVIEQPTGTWTEARIMALPDDGMNHEIVAGELIMSPKNNFEHEQICARLLFALETFNRRHQSGAVIGSNLGYWMSNQNCRAPDVSFIRRERLARLGFRPGTRTFFPEAPDLAVEVLSPTNTPAEIAERLADFFASGTALAWIIDPGSKSVTVYHAPNVFELVRTDGVLTGDDLLPGFRHPVADLFADWAW